MKTLPHIFVICLFLCSGTSALSVTDPAKISSTRKKVCLKMYRSSLKAYKRLFQKLPPDILINPRSPDVKITKMTYKECIKGKGLRTAKKALAKHSGKIGVLLPLSGVRQEINKAILSGMVDQFKFSGLDFKNQVIVKDTHGFTNVLEAKLAEMIFVHKVGLIIGGTSKEEANVLAKFAQKLRVPTILLSQKTDEKTHSNVFHVFPSESYLAKSLAEYVQSQDYTKVGILLPQSRRKDRLSEKFEAELNKLKIDTSSKFLYTPNNYASMEKAARKMFHIDDESRHLEFQDLFLRKKEEAKLSGTAFKVSSVILPPKIEVDAIYLPDDFRNVRHFVKIFKYLGVSHLPLIGNQQWRARELVDPPEPFLKGSVFIDFIGNYKKLPRGIPVAGAHSKFFANPEDTMAADLKLIGAHAINLARKSLIDPKVKRNRLKKVLAKIENDGSRYFKAKMAFDKHHTANWPAFLFRVAGNRISLQKEFTGD